MRRVIMSLHPYPSPQAGQRIHRAEIRNGSVRTSTHKFDGELSQEFFLDTAASVGYAAMEGSSLTTGVSADKIAPFMKEMAQFALKNYARASVTTVFRDAESATLGDVVKTLGSIRATSQIPHEELIIVGSVDPLINIESQEPSPAEIQEINELAKLIKEPTRTGGEYSPSIAIVSGQLAMGGALQDYHQEIFKSFAHARTFTGNNIMAVA